MPPPPPPKKAKVDVREDSRSAWKITRITARDVQVELEKMRAAEERSSASSNSASQDSDINHRQANRAPLDDVKMQDSSGLEASPDDLAFELEAVADTYPAVRTMIAEGTDPAVAVYDAVRIFIAQCVSNSLGVDLQSAYAGVDYGKKGSDFTVAFTPNDWIEAAVPKSPFVHFTVRTSTLARAVLGQVHNLTHCTPTGLPAYGGNASGHDKKVVLEYSSPNIAKQFHVGHMRSTILGAFLANVYRACGWEVVSLNYLGDWGKQFGLVAVGFERYGDAAALERDPIKHIFEVYVKINQDAKKDEAVHEAARVFFQRMETGDQAALALWQQWRDLSIEKYEAEYAQLNISFDEYIGESMVSHQIQDEAFVQLVALGLTKEAEDGGTLIDLEAHKLQTTVLRKKDGTSLYLIRDIAGAIQRWHKYQFDKMIYVISSQQDLHMAQVLKTLDLMGYEWADRLEHINHGLILGMSTPQGTVPMSTRLGTVVFLEDIVRKAAMTVHEHMQKNEAKYAAIEDPEAVALEIGVCAVKIQDMAAKRILNYNFAEERVFSFEGDTGPYLQYTHVRLASLERKNPDVIPLPPPDEINTELLDEHQARAIIFLLGTYPDVVRTALKTHEPSGVVTFAMRLARLISSALEALAVKYEEDLDKKRARMWLFISARDVLGAAMRLLTLTPLERM
ncbi:arginyl-tRNA synthetase [Auriculariales sp. MPI-PUGE-AT-0066]|nr:arginyl-tRNA synthetase [Auriculariales sp. MPI-PUGE-AT-0066]